MAEPVTLPIHCPYCGRPVKMQYVRTTPSSRRGTSGCPYAECCQMDVVILYGGPPTVSADVFRQDVE